MKVLNIFTTTVSLLFVALIAYIVWNVYSQYRTASGTTWERLLSAARNSATMLWAKFVLFVSGFVANLDTIAGMLGGDDAKNFINSYISNPKEIAAIMASIALVSMWARLRTL